MSKAMVKTEDQERRRALLARFKSSLSELSHEQRLLAQLREKGARAAVNSGRDPREDYDDDDLRKLYSPDELDLLIDAAETRQAERERGQERYERRRALDSMVKRIRTERAEAERRDVEREARRRLGMPED